MDKVLAEFTDLSWPDQFEPGNLGLQFGLAEWHKGQDARLLMKQAFASLNEGETGANPS
jgi:hypothetical protein